MTEKTVSDIYNKNDFTDPSTLKTVVAVREYNKRLGFSQKWATDFVYRVVMLAKKEKQPKGVENWEFFSVEARFASSGEMREEVSAKDKNRKNRTIAC